MKTWTIDVEQRVAAEPGVVWQLLADVDGWHDWSAFRESALERPAPTGDPNGVGAIRRFRSSTGRSIEEVVAFEPGRHFAYRLLSGLPVRDYRADVTLEPVDGRTVVRWRSHFHRGMPLNGRFMRVALERFIRRLVADLARRAESVSRPTPS